MILKPQFDDVYDDAVMSPFNVFGTRRLRGNKRPPAVAGGFYPASKNAIISLIEDCFKHEFGPSKIPRVGKRKGKLIGLVVPHAGWVYSGPIAAHSYAALYEDGYPETFIIMGPNHTGLGSFVATTDITFETPLGDIEVDKDLMKEMLGTIIDNDFEAHSEEHSIEVQLPFLQYPGHEFKFVPITIAIHDIKTAHDIANAIVNAVKRTGRDVVIIASTDFTHAGFMYRDSPPDGYTPGEYATRKDRAVIDKIKAYDAEGVINIVRDYRITMCGPGCVASMLLATKQLGGRTVEFLKYATSQDIKKEKYADLAVGYGAFAIYK